MKVVRLLIMGIFGLILCSNLPAQETITAQDVAASNAYLAAYDRLENEVLESNNATIKGCYHGILAIEAVLSRAKASPRFPISGVVEIGLDGASRKILPDHCANVVCNIICEWPCKIDSCCRDNNLKGGLEKALSLLEQACYGSLRDRRATASFINGPDELVRGVLKAHLEKKGISLIEENMYVLVDETKASARTDKYNVDFKTMLDKAAIRANELRVLEEAILY